MGCSFHCGEGDPKLAKAVRSKRKATKRSCRENIDFAEGLGEHHLRFYVSNSENFALRLGLLIFKRLEDGCVGGLSARAVAGKDGWWGCEGGVHSLGGARTGEEGAGG